jgi:hypothetical protein
MSSDMREEKTIRSSNFSKVIRIETEEEPERFFDPKEEKNPMVLRLNAGGDIFPLLFPGIHELKSVLTIRFAPHASSFIFGRINTGMREV